MSVEVPEGWNRRELGQVARLVMGQSPPSELCNDAGVGIPFFQGNAEFGARSPVPRKWIEPGFKLAEAGDVLVSVRAPVGELNVAAERCVIGRGLAAVRAQKIDTSFAYYLMHSVAPRLSLLGQGSTFAAVNSADLRTMDVVLPPLPEQRKIAAILSSVDEAIQTTEAVIEQTRRVKEGLLQDLLTRGIGHTRFKQTEIGEIPESWEVATVERALDISNARRKPISADIREGMPGAYPYWGPTKIQDRINEWAFDGEYALIGEDGDHFLKWQHAEMTNWATGKFNVNNHAHVIGSGKRAAARWFYYYFMHRDLRSVLTRQGAGRYKLTKAALSSLRIAVPSMDEQQAIIQRVDAVREPIRDGKRNLARLRATKSGLLQDLLTGKVRVSV